MSSTKRTNIGKSGIGQLMIMLESRQRDMRDKDATVEQIISSVQTASSLHNAKKTSLATETALLNSILNDIDAMNTFLKSIILIENLFNKKYQPHKKAQEEARAQHAPNISKYEDKPKTQNKSNSFVELIFGGQTHVTSFQQWLDKVLKMCNSQNIKIKSNTGSKVKAIERTFYKAFYVYDCNNDGYKDITDLLRCSLVFDSFVDLYKCFTVIETLAEQSLGGILRVKDRFHPQQMPFGYRDLMINILCPNSTEIVCELQLQFAAFYQYKKVSHKMYKLARLFDVDDENLAYNYAAQYLRPKLGSFEVYKLTKDDMDDEKAAAAEMTYGELLTSWGLSQYIGAMEEEGWEDPTSWSELTDEDLKNDMGFKKGHIRKFNKAYKQWVGQMQNGADDSKESEKTVVISREHKEEPSGFKCGRYKINTAGHIEGKQPAGWGLSAWNAHGAKRNDVSSWVAVHEGDHWPCEWFIEPGKVQGTYRIKTAGHIDGKQPAGWGLSAWNAHGAKRNDASSRVAVHEGDHWPCDWYIVPGTQKNTWRIKTAGHGAGKQPPGWGLSAWNAHGAKRNDVSSWVHVHEGNHWPCDWILKEIK